MLILSREGDALTAACAGVELHHHGNQVVKVEFQPIRRAELLAPCPFWTFNPPFGRERIAPYNSLLQTI